LGTSVQLLDEMTLALDQLRSARGSPAWRETVIASTTILSRGVAGLLASLSGPLGEDDLRARRLARVKVAEIQLYQAAQVKAGQAAGDLYGALQTQIDEARAAFSEQFLPILHQEIVRTLAHNDEALLGPRYPMP
jgi:hypothetical protein